MDCSPPGSSIHGIFQARVLEWGATAFSNRPPEACKLEYGKYPWFLIIFFFSLSLFKKFYLGKIAFQCCVSLCCTTAKIHHNYTCITSLLSLPPSPHAAPSGRHGAPGWAPRVTQQLLTSHLLYTWQCMYVSATFSVRPTLSFPHCVHKSILYT